MEENHPDNQRIDRFLDLSCLFKTRSQAKIACIAGKVEINKQKAKPHKKVKVGDVITITRTGYKQTVIIKKLVDSNIPKKEARELYEDITPSYERERAKLFLETRKAHLRKPKTKKELRKLRKLKRRY